MGQSHQIKPALSRFAELNNMAAIAVPGESPYLSDVDHIVLQAMLRWPNVPSVYGWLKLDRRGRWLIKNDCIANPLINEFIGRNYMAGDAGRWHFQNGPQRVFVEMEYTPYIHRIWRKSDGSLTGETHTGLPIGHPSYCWLDDAGGLLIDCEHGVGCVETQSLETLVSEFSDTTGKSLTDETIMVLLENRAWHTESVRLRWGPALLPIGFVPAIEVANHFGFDPSPKPLAGQLPC